MSDDLTIAPPDQLERSIRVLIVDDNAVVRTGLRSLIDIADDVDVVGEASDGVLAESMVQSLQPDVVLLDVRMPRQDGVATARAIAGQTTVIMLTFTEEPEHIQAALEAGANGYLVHGSFDAGTLVQTIKGAALGAGAFSPQALAAIRAGASTATPQRDTRQDKLERFGLSERQGELMDLISQGKTNRDIAGELFLAEKTVKNHINAIFGKLVVTTRAEAIALWLGSTER